MQPASSPLPLLLAGPIVRHVSPRQFTLWLVTRTAAELYLHLHNKQQNLFEGELNAEQVHRVQIGQHAFIVLVELPVEIPPDQAVYYDLRLRDNQQWHNLASLAPNLCYPQQTSPYFHRASQLREVLHGSCRKPHGKGEDALLAVDARLAEQANSQQRPDLLIFSGDQMYMDDVAGPMLLAIQQVIALLGLYPETFSGATITSSEALPTHPHNLYQREKLLPHTKQNKDLYSRFFKAKSKPLFTSVNAKNHLLSLGEMLAMYLLSWSPTLWTHVQIQAPALPDELAKRFADEQQTITHFVAGLPKVQRALAHVPCYMIFDDHDVTDDWNLTRAWEEAVYQHPFSKRIIGNALLGYWLCQGWGNAPQTFTHWLSGERALVKNQRIADQDQAITTLLNWQQWHYQLATQPPVLVMDTRTQRWRSESKAHKPSGLMDWEQLCELQQQLIGKQAVILVSPAPIFGVKLIETIQKVFASLGGALMVDAENWMAHKGAASVMLNIFRHPKTPPNFIILSGDVHYSFVYQITLKFRRFSPQILQITASGIKNTFPDGLLRKFDWLNQMLYARYSPLNWLTQRRTMRVRTCRPQSQPERTLVNQTGIGQLTLDDQGQANGCCILHPELPAQTFTLKGESAEEG